MTPIETHSYKNWQIEIYQKQPDSFGYHCYSSNGEEDRKEGYKEMQDAVEAGQNYIDEQIRVNSPVQVTKEVGSPTENEDTTPEDLNDL
jgi:hypothetical protein